MLRNSFLLLCCLAALFSACKKDGDTPPDGPASITCTVNGQPWTATVAEGETDGPDLFLYAVAANGDELNIWAESNTPGTYTFTNESVSDNFAYWEPGNNTFRYYTLGTNAGTITVTHYVDNKASGTFSLDMITQASDTLRIRDGKFNNIFLEQ